MRADGNALGQLRDLQGNIQTADGIYVHGKAFLNTGLERRRGDGDAVCAGLQIAYEVTASFIGGRLAGDTGGYVQNLDFRVRNGPAGTISDVAG